MPRPAAGLAGHAATDTLMKLTQLAKVVREAGHLGAVHPGVDEQHASPAVHDNGVALAELALVDQHTLRDLPQQGCKATVPSARQQRFAQRASAIGWGYSATEQSQTSREGMYQPWSCVTGRFPCDDLRSR
jgi:hypothetical protein